MTKVELSSEIRDELVRRVRASTTPQRDVFRAKVILSCADGYSAREAAQRVGTHPRTVERWRGRFQSRGLDGLSDAPRSGRKPKFESVTRMEIVSIACEPLPRTDGRTRGTIEDIRRAVLSRGLAPEISWTTIQRTLANADLRPHLVQGWVHSPDPLFREKVAEITDLYLNRPADSVVLSVDEKTGMQALQRRFPDRPAAPGRKRRRDYEYKRHGTQSLICAFDVHTGHVVAGCNDTRTAADLVRFMERVAELYPTGKVHIVWDNLNIHYDGADARWARFNERHGHRFVFHYTPKHASWVNQVELFFSILERQCLRHASFTSTTELRWNVLNFISSWNETARPFRWTFTGYPLQSGSPKERAA